MSYAAWSVIAGEQPTTSKWNILGTNDASFNDGTGIGAVLGSPNFLTGVPVQIVGANSTAVATGTTVIPSDDTIPQNTEGDQYMTLAITPKATTNRLSVEVTALLSTTAANNYIGALFQDSTANALAASKGRDTVGAAPGTLRIVHDMAAGTTSATTFKFRAGPQAAGTLTFNGEAGVRLFGGITLSSMKITEYKV